MRKVGDVVWAIWNNIHIAKAEISCVDAFRGETGFYRVTSSMRGLDNAWIDPEAVFDDLPDAVYQVEKFYVRKISNYEQKIKQLRKKYSEELRGVE